MASVSSSTTNGDSLRKKKKREDRTIQHVMHSVENLGTPELRLEAIIRKFADLYDEERVNKERVNEIQRKLAQIENERSHLQTENNKLGLAKDRLENLCRELQKMNKTIKDESLAVAKANEDRRLEVSANFQTQITEIQTQITEYHEQNQILRQENERLTSRLREILSQFETRANDMERCLRDKDATLQQLQVKWKQREESIAEMNKQHQAALEKCQEDIKNYQTKCIIMEELEKKHREQTDFYKEKYDEFHKTISQSADVYLTCKTEMEKMAKKIRQLEKENLNWKTRVENSERSANQLAKEKISYDATLSNFNTKVAILENVCRALQLKLRTSPEVEKSPQLNLDSVPKIESELKDLSETMAQSSISDVDTGSCE